MLVQLRSPSPPQLRFLLRVSLPLLLLTGLATGVARAEQWSMPTPEELSMTSQPQVPGASAVYLFREETTEDNLHMFSVYVRLKVLNEGGKKFGDIELKYAAGGPGSFNIDGIAGRTIHPDGSVVMFTGKPYEKLIEKGQGYRYMAKVFSMPDVQVGSIIEYRYKLRYGDFYFVPPQWYIQSELYTRGAHYLWKPTGKQLVSSDERGQLTNSISWTPILPADSKVKVIELPGNGQNIFEVSVHDIPPAPQEEYMPPISSFSYRVLFYYSAYRTGDEFWKGESKFWARKRDKFIGSGNAVNAAVKELTLPTDSDEQKLRKLYIAVQKLENTDFTRNRSGAEEKAQGFGEIRSTDDIWLRKRGSSDQLAELFVAMARSASMKSYLMYVTDRSRRLFYPAFLSLSQLDDYIAIVNVGGKEHFFDPGSRYCAFDHLMWKHTLSGGIRQVDGGATIAQTPAESYTVSRIQRVANLTMQNDGTVAGTVSMTYMGAPALHWRQASLEGDAESLRRDLHTTMENLLPHGMEVKLASIEKLEDFDQPLTVVYDVKGELGSATGKRLILPGDLFEANSKTTFPHEKRDVAIAFNYSHIVQDAIRINFPKDFAIESLPIDGKLHFEKFAVYNLSAEAAPTSFTVRRNYTLGETIYLAKEYPELRTFYNGMEAKDQQSVILRVHAPSVEKASSAAN